MAETMRRRAGGVFCLVQALVVLCCFCAVRVGAEVKQQLTVTSPFDKHDHKGSRIIPYFEKTGATNIMQSFVRVRAREGEREGGRLECFFLSASLWR